MAISNNLLGSTATALVTGSPNVFANNQAVGRIGDAYSCGITVNAGSPNVIANG